MCIIMCAYVGDNAYTYDCIGALMRLHAYTSARVWECMCLCVLCMYAHVCSMFVCMCPHGARVRAWCERAILASVSLVICAITYVYKRLFARARKFKSMSMYSISMSMYTRLYKFKSMSMYSISMSMYTRLYKFKSMSMYSISMSMYTRLYRPCSNWLRIFCT